MGRIRLGVFGAAVLAVWLAAPQTASSFCGFYVSGAGADLYNNATVVVMMRSGTRTVLSMQNNYSGPPENFAMVVPVPTVLDESNVQTLQPELFTRVDQLASPRLVEYFERDPCYRPPQPGGGGGGSMAPSAAPMPEMAEAPPEDLGVTIEAEFVVAEYQIVILSAEDSTGLDTWLKRENYTIPDGAEPLLRPYVAAGSKFFVAKVDASKVRFEEGKTMLSPLRFHYDSEAFSLPVRLGLINSSGQQDLLVHIIGESRYEVANYENAFIPTNLIVTDKTSAAFGSFYNALFDATLEKADKPTVVTEYAWTATKCDPCPTPGLSPQELGVLGGDLGGMAMNLTLTRLHARYDADSLGEDLVFREAEPIAGGTGTPDQQGHVDSDVSTGTGANTFQGRYIVLHWWEGSLSCDHPVRGIWDGHRGNQIQAATEIAFAPRGDEGLDSYVRQAVPQIGYTPPAEILHRPPPQIAPRSRSGKGCGCRTTGALDGLAAALLIGLGLVVGRRRSRRGATTDLR